MPEQWLTAVQAARLLKISPRTVARLRLRGELPAAAVGSSGRIFRFRRDDVLALRVVQPGNGSDSGHEASAA